MKKPQRAADKLRPIVRHVIILCGKSYDVRIVDGRKEIKVAGEWLSHGAFIDFLMLTDAWEQLCELAKFGYAKIRKANTSVHGEPARSGEAIP